MAKKLYVGGLPYATTEDQLKDLFAQAGTVESGIIIMDKMTGRSKGFGFVEMETEEEAKAAISKLNDTDFGGRKLVVNEAKPMEERRRPMGSYNGGRGGFQRGRGQQSGRREGGRGSFGRNRGSNRGRFRGGRG